jgi:hypothetical protein
MSLLEPGATYVYERANGCIYARKIGDSKRVLIGEEYISDHHLRRSEIAQEWVPIILAAEHNPALQDALERAKVIYELSRQQDPLFHHPV